MYCNNYFSTDLFHISHQITGWLYSLNCYFLLHSLQIMTKFRKFVVGMLFSCVFILSITDDDYYYCKGLWTWLLLFELVCGNVGLRSGFLIASTSSSKFVVWTLHQRRKYPSNKPSVCWQFWWYTALCKSCRYGHEVSILYENSKYIDLFHFAASYYWEINTHISFRAYCPGLYEFRWEKLYWNYLSVIFSLLENTFYLFLVHWFFWQNNQHVDNLSQCRISRYEFSCFSRLHSCVYKVDDVILDLI